LYYRFKKEVKLNSNPWKGLFYSHFYEKSEPILTLNDINLPAASLWTGIQYWVKFFRRESIVPGDRILLCLPPSIPFVYVLLACFWENITLFITSPNNFNPDLGEKLDCILDIHDKDLPNSISLDGLLPVKILGQKRKTHLPLQPEINLFLQTSGSTGHSKWIGLSSTNIYSVLQSHLPHLQDTQKILISTLPWTHAFGLVLDLLVGLFSAKHIIREESNGKDLENLIQLLDSGNSIWWNSVPLGFEKLLNHPLGEGILKNLKGGIIGGAPISKFLSDRLKGTNLRVGYGQTEASPGIALGDKGEFYPSFLGRALGCETRISQSQTLEFKGANANHAIFKGEKIEILEKNRWVNTGDICFLQEEKLFFGGRIDFSFKLPNGKMFYPEYWEKNILEKCTEIKNIALCNIADNFILIMENSLQCDWDFLKSNLPNSITSRLRCIQMEIPISPKGNIDRNKLIHTLTQEQK
jgi:acyl-CoA synthetase (AMP-forming)/AMP-acid ligase II